MRHLGSILLSLIFAPVIYVLIGVGAFYARPDGVTSTHHYVQVAIGIPVLLGAAVLYSVLVLTRLSPIGPMLVGLAFLGVSGWALFGYASFVDAMPSTRLLGVDGAAIGAAGPGALLLAVPLLLTALSPRRWRRYASGGPSTVAMPSGPVSYPPPPGYEPSYPPAAGYQPPTDSAGQPLDPTRPMFPPPLTPPLMQPPVSPAPVPADLVDPEAPTHRFGT